jgi:hypothetical protein
MRGTRDGMLRGYLAAAFSDLRWPGGICLFPQRPGLSGLLSSASGKRERRMAELDEAWDRWRGLNEADRERFLHLLREQYAQARRRRENGTAHRMPMPTSLDQLVLTEADFALAVDG